MGFYTIFNTVISEGIVDLDCEEQLLITSKTNGGVEDNFKLYRDKSSDTSTTLDDFSLNGGYSFKVVD